MIFQAADHVKSPQVGYQGRAAVRFKSASTVVTTKRERLKGMSATAESHLELMLLHDFGSDKVVGVTCLACAPCCSRSLGKGVFLCRTTLDAVVLHSFEVSPYYVQVRHPKGCNHEFPSLMRKGPSAQYGIFISSAQRLSMRQQSRQGEPTTDTTFDKVMLSTFARHEETILPPSPCRLLATMVQDRRCSAHLSSTSTSHTGVRAYQYCDSSLPDGRFGRVFWRFLQSTSILNARSCCCASSCSTGARSKLGPVRYRRDGGSASARRP